MPVELTLYQAWVTRRKKRYTHWFSGDQRNPKGLGKAESPYTNSSATSLPTWNPYITVV